MIIGECPDCGKEVNGPCLECQLEKWARMTNYYRNKKFWQRWAWCARYWFVNEETGSGYTTWYRLCMKIYLSGEDPYA